MPFRLERWSLVFLASFLIFLADQLLLVALPYRLYERTGNSELSVGTYALEWGLRLFAGAALLPLLKGAHPVRPLLIAEALRFLLVLGLLFVGAEISPFWLSVAVIANGFLSALSMVSVHSLSGLIATHEQFIRVDAKVMIADQAALLVGGILAGLITQAYSAEVLFGVVPLFQIFAIIALQQFSKISPYVAPEELRPNVFKQLKLGYLVLFSTSALLLGVARGFLGNGIIGLTEAYAPTIGRAQPLWFGGMFSLAGLLGIFCGVASPKLFERFGVRGIWILSCFLYALAAALAMVSSGIEGWVAVYGLSVMAGLLGGAAFRVERKSLVSDTQLPALISAAWITGQASSVLLPAFLALNPSLVNVKAMIFVCAILYACSVSWRK